MKDPIDRILEALQSHPDPFCARKIAEQELDEIVGSESEGGCEFCDGYGLVDRFDEGKEEGEDEGRAMERGRVVKWLQENGYSEAANKISSLEHLDG